MEYIEFLFISLVLYSGISPNVSASLNLKVLHERSDGRERCVEECGQLNRFCDVEDGRSALPVPFSCGACKPGYRQEKIREQYKEECLTNSDDSFIDRIANANHKQSNADEGEVLSPVIRQDNGGSPVERLSVEERAPAAADDAVAATDATSSTTVTTAKSTPSPTATRDPTDNGHAEPHVQEEHYSDGDSSSYAGVLFIAVVAGCSIAGVVGLVVAGVCWYRLQKNVKAASEAEYPAYGVTGPTTKEPGPGSPGDRKLAHSAQMYHYQHQKQQMLAMEKANGDMNKDEEDDFEEENEEGDYTVYECPGLAPTGEMEVKNPLFSEETPVTPSGGDDMTDQK